MGEGAKGGLSVPIVLVGAIFGCSGGVAALFGVLFLLAAFAPDSANPGGRLTVGIVLLGVGLLIWGGGAAALIAIWKRTRPAPKVVIEQQIDLSGNVQLEALHCQHCGATLDSSSVTVEAGAVMVHCPYCGAAYQLVEEPKW